MIRGVPRLSGAPVRLRLLVRAGRDLYDAPVSSRLCPNPCTPGDPAPHGRSARVLDLERIEIHFLANPDPQLRFALLTDFVDAKEETLPEDAQLLGFAQGAISALNAKYASAASPETPDAAASRE